MRIRGVDGMRRVDRSLSALVLAGLLVLSPAWAAAAGARAAGAPSPSPAPVEPAPTDPEEIAARKAWLDARAAHGDDDGRTLSAAREYAFQMAFNDKPAPAIALMSDTLDRVRRLAGAGSPDTATIASDLGWILMENERFAEAEAPLAQAWATLKRAKPPKDGPGFRVLGYLTTTQTALGRGADRLPDYDAVIAARRAVHGDTGDTLKALAAKAG